MTAVTASRNRLAAALAVALAMAVAPSAVVAQGVDHSMHMPPPPKAPAASKPAEKPKAAKPAAPRQPAPRPAAAGTQHPLAHAPHGAADPAGEPSTTHAGHATAGHAPKATDHSTMGHDAQGMDHSAMGHAAQGMDHSTMGHDAQGMDHSAMGHDAEGVDHSAMGHDAEGVDHSAMGHDAQGMDHSAMGHGTAAPTEPRTPIPALTDADRAAAIPPAQGHAAHDNALHRFVLFDRLEVWDSDPGTGAAWEGTAWIGTDLDKLWVRSEGERVDGHTEAADVEVLYGRAIATWWDLVVGVRHDFAPGQSQDFAAIGVMGLAPYKFEVQATAYVGESGQTAARVEAEYDVLLTNRLVLQPLVEANFHGKNDEARGIGSGLGTIEAGLRLRYEFTRQFAPYVGVVRERAFGKTADYRLADGEDVDDTRVVAGLRIWF